MSSATPNAERTETGVAARLGEAALVAAARAGDDDAFRELTDPHVRALRVHCYRMLGSLHDAEDAVQEVMLRAWRSLGTFRGDSAFLAWLYKIATNACLNAIARRRRRLERLARPAAPDGHGDVPPAADVPWLEPYPDTLLGSPEPHEADPAARYAVREGVQLAFIAVLQHLPPKQRAVLILREVLGWRATEVADLLETSVQAVNSALQRARATLETKLPPGSLEQASLDGLPESRDELFRRFVEAWEDGDLDLLAALLKEDATLAMPPEPLWFRGREAIVEFFATGPACDVLGRLRLVETRANHRPAFAAYLHDDASGDYRAYGIMVLDVRDGVIEQLTGFADPTLFPLFGLPPTLEAERQ